MTQGPPSVEGRSRWGSGLIDHLLRIPLLWKILIANAVIVGAGVIVGTTAVAAFVRADPGRPTGWLILVLGGAGTALSLAINAMILRVALSPLREIEDSARRVESGALDARARISRVADRDLARLARVMNGMLDRLAHHRARLGRLTAKALQASEEERRRISRELHDDAAQRIAAPMVRLRTVLRAVDDEPLRSRLEGFRDELEDTLEAIRRYARDLRPPALDDAGFLVAVAALARRTGERGVDMWSFAPRER